MALEGQLDQDTRDNLFKSYNASRALVHVINDLLVRGARPHVTQSREALTLADRT